MTVEEAIKYLKRMRQHFIRADRISTPSLKVSMRVWVEACDVAIEALEKMMNKENA